MFFKFCRCCAGLNSKVTSFIKISVSLDGKHAALFTDSGLLWMGSSDFQVIAH